MKKRNIALFGSILLLSVPLLITIIWVLSEEKGNGWRFSDDSSNISYHEGETTLKKRAKLEPEEIPSTLRMMIENITPEFISDLGGVTGIVVESKTDTPLSGVTVSLPAKPELSTQTDERGEFRILDLEPRKLDFYFSLAGWAPAYIEHCQIKAGRLKHLHVALEKGQSLTIEVLAKKGGTFDEPVPNAMIRLLEGGAAANRLTSSRAAVRARRKPSVIARTDSNGCTQVNEVRPGVYHALVEASGFPAWAGDILFQSPGEIVRIELKAGGTIEGFVLASDGSPANGEVLIASVDEIEDNQLHYEENCVKLSHLGYFRFKGVPSGKHHLAAILPGGEVALTNEPLHVKAGEIVQVELQATMVGTVSGQVVDQYGSPISGVEIALIQSGTRNNLHPVITSFPGTISENLAKQRQRVANTDGKGHYQLDRVRTASGRIRINARLEGYTMQSKELLIKPGEHIEQDFMLYNSDSFIAGRVLGPFSDLSGVRIIAFMEDLDERPSFNANTLEDGSFKVVVPNAGRIKVTASCQRFTPPCRIQEPRRIYGVTPGQSDLEFVIEPETLLQLRVVDESGSAVTTIELNLFDDLSQRYDPYPKIRKSHDGCFEVVIDSERNSHATVCSGGYEPIEIWDIDKKTGEEILVNLMRNGEDVPICVEDSEGNRIAGAQVSLAWFGEVGYPLESRLVPTVRTDENGEGVLLGVPSNAPRDFLVVANSLNAPPLVHLEASQIISDGVRWVLRLPSSREVEIRFHTAFNEPVDGGCGILSSAGVPMTIKCFGCLQSKMPLDGADPMRLVNGSLLVHLIPGEYFLFFLREGALIDDIRTYTILVSENDENQFSFTVD